MNPLDYNRLLSHAGVLIEQNRYVQAHEKLIQLRNIEPNDPDLLKMLIMCNLGMGMYEDADFNCRQLIKLAPEESFAYYALANVSLNTRYLSRAKEEINEAIRIHPYFPEYFALKSNIDYHMKEYSKALESADTGLELDAEHVDCLNARASALVALDRNAEAYDTINKALYNDPSNPETHANLGWTKLRSGQVEKALIHFKTALTEEPMHEYARAGMLQAMKSKFPFYRYFLQLMLWVGKLSNKNQWYIIIGSYVVYRGLLELAKYNTSWQPLLFVVVVAMVLFFLTTWLFSPLMNLYMLTNSFGRLTMTNGEKESAKYVGIALFSGITSLFLYLFSDNPGFLNGGIAFLLLMIPLGSMNNAFLDKNRLKLRIFSGVVTFLAVIGAILSIVMSELINILSVFAMIALVIYQWYTNYILIKE